MSTLLQHSMNKRTCGTNVQKHLSCKKCLSSSRADQLRHATSAAPTLAGHLSPRKRSSPLL
eukprot:5848075-Pyramimonas_sp.AAC.1